MQPVAFGGCFGWLHHSPRSFGSDTAVLLCHGLSHDACTAHRPFRMLADRLAEIGYPTLRFDYLGTGDSCDGDLSDPLAEWQQSVHAAADWVRENTSACRIVMIGLRFGSALATIAASVRNDVIGLVLLEPVLRGKSYVGQLVVEARLQQNLQTAPSNGLDVNDLRLSAEAIDRMRQIDLSQIRPPHGCALAVFTRLQTTTISACVKLWRDAGVDVVCGDFGGLEAFLRPTHLADEPIGDFDKILTWLRMAVPAQQMHSQPVEPGGSAVWLQHTGCVESPVRFGIRQHLFGMVCQPDGNPPSDLAVIIGNTGGYSHHGFGRFGVELARYLANQGIVSLRLDFAGLGDSTNTDGEGVTHVFEIDRIGDIGAAIETLQQMGHRRFAVIGLCSGAYHALQAALGDERVEALVAINLPWFTLRYDKPGPSSNARKAMTALSVRSVRTLLLFAKGDAGLKSVESHFGPGGTDLKGYQDVVVSIMEGVDHNLTGRTMRHNVAYDIGTFLRQG